MTNSVSSGIALEAIDEVLSRLKLHMVVVMFRLGAVVLLVTVIGAGLII